jgi:hypothetical protein
LIEGGQRLDWFAPPRIDMDQGMRSTCLVPALSVIALITGCGGSSGSTVRPPPHESAAVRDVRSTVQGWLDSLQTPNRQGDDARACTYLTRGLQKAITQELRMRGEHATCKTYAAKWTGGANPPGRDGAHVTAIDVTGTKATVTLEAPPDRESNVQLKRVGSRWRIDNY